VEALDVLAHRPVVRAAIDEPDGHGGHLAFIMWRRLQTLPHTNKASHRRRGSATQLPPAPQRTPPLPHATPDDAPARAVSPRRRTAPPPARPPPGTCPTTRVLRPTTTSRSRPARTAQAAPSLARRTRTARRAAGWRRPGSAPRTASADVDKPPTANPVAAADRRALPPAGRTPPAPPPGRA